MKSHQIIIIPLLLSLTLISCEDLEHANPADPAFELQPPTLLTVDAVTDTSMVITWKDNEEHSKEFVIQRKSGSASYATIGTVTKNILTFRDMTCVLGAEYSYSVRSKVESNLSVSSNIIKKATEFPAPSDLSAVSVSDSEIQLSWTDNTGYETGFRVERDAGSGFVKLGTVSSDITEYTDTGLTYGQSYTYRVVAYTASITSDYSETITATAMMPLVDYDGNIYEIIQIGNQVWMADNLKVTHYRDGTPIPNLTTDGDWIITSSGAYCIYKNNANNELDTYGALYNWYAAFDSRNIAPGGWHVPTDSEWKELEMTLGMSKIEADGIGYRGTNEGSKLAGNADLWNSGALVNHSEFGTSGFTALPGGYRGYNDGHFYGMGATGYLWSATEYYSNYAWNRTLTYNSSDVSRSANDGRSGFSVRLVRD